MKEGGDEIICTNRRARHEYTIEETFEAGLVLKGSEVKSLREGKANLQDSYAHIEHGEALLLNAHVSPYFASSRFNHSPRRARKLLLHKRELLRLIGRVKQKGLTLVPLRLYFKNGIAKVELALARGKKIHDKRDALKKKVMEREIERSQHWKKAFE
jgi:SsrA-binding protein